LHICNPGISSSRLLHCISGTKIKITISQFEQCFYYVPIDASAAVVIAAFQKAYEATGKKRYLEKSIALANTMMGRRGRKAAGTPPIGRETNAASHRVD